MYKTCIVTIDANFLLKLITTVENLYKIKSKRIQLVLIIFFYCYKIVLLNNYFITDNLGKAIKLKSADHFNYNLPKKNNKMKLFTKNQTKQIKVIQNIFMYKLRHALVMAQTIYCHSLIEIYA